MTYPTWCVNLWILNDEPLYRAASDVVARASNPGQALREMVEEMAPTPESGMFSDLMGRALGEVDWDEIAEHLCEEEEEEEEEE